MSSIDFDLRQLEIFSKIVELQSFSKAADAVFLAQASVSERIANLEKSIGTKLLDRMGRQIVPTKAGELLYKHAVQLLDMKKSACHEMEKFLGLRQGDIRVGGSTIPGEYILPELIVKFYQKYPFVSVQLTIADTREIVELVIEGKLELGVTGSKSPEKNLIQYNLWKDELVLTVNMNHRWANKKSVIVSELFDEPFIMREAGSGTLKIMSDYLNSSAQKGMESLKTVAHLGTSTAVKEGIKAGLGISILSSRAIETEVKAGILKTVKIEGLPKITRDFYLIRDRRRMASPLCQAMLEFLQGS
jgi:DNA-binding transcriptional LysR family regulator